MYFNLILHYFDIFYRYFFLFMICFLIGGYMSKNNVVTSDSAANKGPSQGPGFKGSKKGGKSKGPNNTKRINKPQKKG